MPLPRPHAIAPSLDTARVVLAYKSFVENALSHVGLGVTASCTAKALRKSGIWADVWAVPTPDALVQRLRTADADATKRSQLPVTNVAVHAPWVPTENLAAMAAEFPNTTFTVMSHSNFGFLGGSTRREDPP